MLPGGLFYIIKLKLQIMNLIINNKILQILAISISLTFSYHTYVRSKPLNLQITGKIEEYIAYHNYQGELKDKLEPYSVFSDFKLNGRLQFDKKVQVNIWSEIRAKNSYRRRKISPYLGENYLDIKNSKGLIHIGKSSGFNYDFTLEPPTQLIEDDEIIGILSPSETSIDLMDILSFRGFTGDSINIGYATNEINGFRVGINYFPGKFSNSNSFLTFPKIYKNGYEVTLNWKNNIRGNVYSITSGVFKSDAMQPNSTNFAWNFSAKFKVRNFVFGGANIYKKNKNRSTTQFSSIALKYNFGAFGLGGSLFGGKIKSKQISTVKEKVIQKKIEISYKITKGLKTGISTFRTKQIISKKKYVNTGVTLVFINRF